VRTNLIENTKILIEGLKNPEFNKKGISINESNLASVKIIQDISDKTFLSDELFTPEIANALDLFAKDPVIKEIFKHENDPSSKDPEFPLALLQIGDSAKYIFENTTRIIEKDYVPSVEDILRVRAKTTGISEIELPISDELKLLIIDVGGQRSERRKWIHQFENVTAVIFFVALSEYNQTLYEDDKTNRMVESLKLFRDTTNSKWFCNTPIILFLNKKDIFQEKLRHVPLKKIFEDYDGPNTCEKASEFIKNQFLALNENSSRSIYTHITIATDTENMKLVFSDIRNVIIQKVLKSVLF